MKQLYLLIFPCLFFASIECSAQDNAYFTVDYQKVCLGTPIHITDLSTGGNGDVVYFYGDGTASTPPNSNPAHTYTATGIFNLKQVMPISGTVIDPETGTAIGYLSYSLPIKVVSTAKLSASYTLQDNAGVNLFIYDNRFDSYDVDFGDGSGIINISRASSDTTTLNYTYAVSSTYTVTIKGKFSTGNSCSSADLTFSLATVKSIAGSYHPLSNDVLSTKNFITIYSSISTLHVDSIRAETNGLAYYFLKSPDLETINDPCIGFYSTLAGNKMLAHESDYYFYNKAGESIKITPLNEINVPWIFYTYANGDYIEAKVSLKEQITFLGLTDSVKTITLQRKSASNVPIADPVDTLTIKISKNYGFVQTTAFADFPSTYNYPYQLIGLSDPIVGQQLTTTRKLYNFNIDDEFHYRKSYTNVPYYGDETKIIRKVIDKYISTNTDTLIYTFQTVRENTHYTYQQPPAPTIVGPVTYTVSTYKEKHIVNDRIIYPGIEVENQIAKGSYYSKSFNYNGKLLLTNYYMYGRDYNQTDQCWQLILVDGPSNFSSSLEGCGVNYFNADAFPNSNDSILVYYKKGSDVYGQQLVLSNFSKSNEEVLTLYPNPLKSGEELSYHALHFKATQCALYNNSGNKIFESTLEESDSPSIHLPKLQAGLYVVRLVNDKNEYITSKLVIH